MSLSPKACLLPFLYLRRCRKSIFCSCESDRVRSNGCDYNIQLATALVKYFNTLRGRASDFVVSAQNSAVESLDTALKSSGQVCHPKFRLFGQRPMSEAEKTVHNSLPLTMLLASPTMSKSLALKMNRLAVAVDTVDTFTNAFGDGV